MLSIGFIIKMLMSDGFGDKVIQLLIALFIVVIVCFAWWTTNIIEPPHYRTVFLLERRLRRRNSRTRLTTHIQSTSIGGTQTEETSVVTEDSTQSTESVQNSEGNKPPEASTSTNNTRSEEGGSGQIDPSRNIEDEELETIVQIMDADANVVRLRRLAYYENQQGEIPSHTNQEATTSTEENTTETTSHHQSTDSPESLITPDELLSTEQANILNEPIMEHNYAERETVHNINEDLVEDTDSDIKENNDSNIRIKLKYLNDELKLVDGRLEEQLGDFKRRHFQLEFSSNKLVRLIFNGQVLQPDTETLQSCGLFDNCVVHCLVHQQRNVFNESNNSSGSGFTTGSSTRTGGNGGGISQGNNNNNQGRDWDLGNVLFAFVSIILGSAWYFRYEYSHLYTVTATVALVAITGIFTIFLVGVYFPDPQPPQPRVERQSIPT